MVVWEHNSHLGDARATAWGKKGNGMSGSSCGRSSETKPFCRIHNPPWNGDGEFGLGRSGGTEARPTRLHGSFEALFHETGVKRFLLLLRRRAF